MPAPSRPATTATIPMTLAVRRPGAGACPPVAESERPATGAGTGAGDGDGDQAVPGLHPPDDGAGDANRSGEFGRLNDLGSSNDLGRSGDLGGSDIADGSSGSDVVGEKGITEGWTSVDSAGGSTGH